METTSVIKAISKGNVITNAKSWKDSQIGVSIAIVTLAVLIPFLKSKGIDISMDNNLLTAATVIILGIYNGLATIISSTKMGRKK